MYKVMVVDDEPFILEGISSLINWEELGLELSYKADSAEEAIEIFVSNQVDIIITDIQMAEISGLQLIETIQSLDTQVKFIVLSGYDDFHYVKQGIHLGIENYLLKPIDSNELTATLEVTIKKLNQIKHETMVSPTDKQIIKDNVLLRWMNQTIHPRELIERLQLLGLPTRFSTLFVCTSILKTKQEDGEQRWLSTEVSVDILEAIRREWLETRDDVFSFIDLDGELISIFFNVQQEDMLEQLFTAMMKYVEQQYGMSFEICMGDTVNHYNLVHHSYWSAKEQLALKQSINQSHDKMNGFRYSEQQLDTFITGKEKEQLKAYLSEVVDQFTADRDHRPTISSLQSLVIELLVILNKKISRKDFAPMFAKLFRLRNVEQIKQFMLEKAEQLFEQYNQVNEQISPIVEKIVLEVHQNYREELSLKTLANKYNISSVYLGQLFKREKQVSFTEYLNAYRMNIAKELLVTTNAKAYEIGVLVGYPDPNYFYKLFVKYSGFTPSEYRTKFTN